MLPFITIPWFLSQRHSRLNCWEIQKQKTGITLRFCLKDVPRCYPEELKFQLGVWVWLSGNFRTRSMMQILPHKSQYNPITELVWSLLSIPGAIVPKLQTFLLSGTRFWKVLGKYRKFRIFLEVLRFLKITSNNIQSGRPIMTVGWYMS